MRAREFVESLAEKYGLEAVKSWDSDMDIMLPEGKVPTGLLGELKRLGFKCTFHPEDSDNPTEVHIHAPHRKEKSWSDRGWDWELEGTESGPIPGEMPYYGETYLGGTKFSEN